MIVLGSVHRLLLKVEEKLFNTINIIYNEALYSVMSWIEYTVSWIPCLPITFKKKSKGSASMVQRLSFDL